MFSVEKIRNSLREALISYLLRIHHNLEQYSLRNQAELALQDKRRDRILSHRGDPVADRMLTLYLWALSGLVVLCIIMNYISLGAPVLNTRFI
jgi:hypothetical protein